MKIRNVLDKILKEDDVGQTIENHPLVIAANQALLLATNKVEEARKKAAEELQIKQAQQLAAAKLNQNKPKLPEQKTTEQEQIK